jgi:hypothetical protein
MEEINVSDPTFKDHRSSSRTGSGVAVSFASFWFRFRRPGRPRTAFGSQRLEMLLAPQRDPCIRYLVPDRLVELIEPLIPDHFLS